MEMDKLRKESSYYFQHQRKNLYIAMEQVDDWVWDEETVIEFDWLWKQDKPLTTIAKELERSEVAVFLLAFDRLMKGKIEPREGWKIW